MVKAQNSKISNFETLGIYLEYHNMIHIDTDQTVCKLENAAYATNSFSLSPYFVVLLKILDRETLT